MTGIYVALEGIEGAGKSTVASALADRLREDGWEVVTVREPGGTETGEAVRHILLDPEGRLSAWAEALLFAAARAQLAVEVIGPALDRGACVLADRSVYSSLAYQGGGRDLGLDLVEQVNRPGLGPVWPELVVLLRVDPVTGLARQEVEDRIGGERSEFHRRVAAAYDDLAAADPERFHVVDASQPLAQVIEDAAAAIRKAR